jgi:UDP-N-acetylglucosamine acyltransferase
VSIGPYAVIENDVVVGDGAEIGPHAVICRHTTIGAGCRIFHHSSVGAEPQDVKYQGEVSHTRIGDRTIIREFASVHRANGAGEETVIGADCMLMATSHVGHNCVVGQGVTLVNNAGLSGHVEVGDFATIGGLAGVHQFVHIGDHCFIGGFSRVSQDVPPYLLGEGAQRFQLHGPNLIGLKRRGFSKESLDALRGAYKSIFRNRRPLKEVLAEADAQWGHVPEVAHMLEFIKQSKRGVSR